MENTKISIGLEGTTPLLFNRFRMETAGVKGKKQVGVAVVEDPKEKLYLTPEDKIYTPSSHILGCLTNAGKEFKMAGKRGKSFSGLIACSTEIDPDAIEHEIQEWTVHEVSAVNPTTRGRMLVRRPMMPKWKLSFTITLQAGIPSEVFKQILDYGGQFVGIGDWRPQTKGRFGKFIVTRFEELGDTVM